MTHPIDPIVGDSGHKPNQRLRCHGSSYTYRASLQAFQECCFLYCYDLKLSYPNRKRTATQSASGLSRRILKIMVYPYPTPFAHTQQLLPPPTKHCTPIVTKTTPPPASHIKTPPSIHPSINPSTHPPSPTPTPIPNHLQSQPTHKQQITAKTPTLAQVITSIHAPMARRIKTHTTPACPSLPLPFPLPASHQPLSPSQAFPQSLLLFFFFFILRILGSSGSCAVIM